MAREVPSLRGAAPVGGRGFYGFGFVMVQAVLIELLRGEGFIDAEAGSLDRWPLLAGVIGAACRHKRASTQQKGERGREPDGAASGSPVWSLSTPSASWRPRL